MANQYQFIKNLLFIIVFLLTINSHAKCNKVRFGGLDWDSSRFHVAVASYILEEGFDCEIEVIGGSSLPLLTALGQGDVDVIMEVWRDSFKEAWEKLESNGSVINLGVNLSDAEQGFYIPRYLVEGDKDRSIKAQASNLKTVFDLKKYYKLFEDPEVKSKGRFFNCILGWSCEDINTKKLHAYGLNKYFVNFRPGTGAALDAAIKYKYERGEPFVTYYWGPTWVLGKYDMIKLDEPSYDANVWKSLEATKFPDKATDYPSVEIFIYTHKKIYKENKEVIGFLKNYKTTSKQVSDALNYMQSQKRPDAKKAALRFLKNDKSWHDWVSKDIVSKVESKLSLAIEAKDNASFLDLSSFINSKVDFVVKKYGKTFRNLSSPILMFILFVEKVLKIVPWWAFTLFFSLLSLFFLSFKYSTLIFLCLFGIKGLGLWEQSMDTLAIMLISCVISILGGLFLGIIVSKSDKARFVTLPLLDIMQTMPSFVYLIPALMLLGLGKVPAVFATVIYAISPMIRLTDLGIRKIDKSLIEASDSLGVNFFQKLIFIELPLSLATIMTGINQVMMMGLSMVVIASMIGARGLGEEVLLGIQKLDVGRGFSAGLAIVFLAIFLDRISQGLGERFNKVGDYEK